MCFVFPLIAGAAVVELAGLDDKLWLPDLAAAGSASYFTVFSAFRPDFLGGAISVD